MISALKRYIWRILDVFLLKLLSRRAVLEKAARLGYLRRGIINNCQISSKAVLYRSYVVSNCQIGDYTYIAEGALLSQVTIGKFCSIGPNLLAGYGIHPLNGISTSPIFYSTLKQNGFSLSDCDKVVERKPIIIGNDVFIGANVTILDGVTIGNGAVIGAGAVVSKDIPPYAIAIGCPIRIIKYRFNDETILKLQNLEWWNWPFDKLKEVEKNFFEVEEFLNKYNDQ